MYTEIRSETHHSVNTDDNNNICDTGDEDPRPASAASVPQGSGSDSIAPLVALSTTRSKINDAQPQADHGHLSNFVDKIHPGSRVFRVRLRQ
jgi:hypothetical protein